MRLDNYIFEKFCLKSRTGASNLIKKGAVTVNGRVVLKPAFEVSEGADIQIHDEGFASLGGYKLDKALDLFGINLINKKAADIGASNGGFTDCMLRRGAEKVYAVDVAECSLPPSLAGDSRVIIKDKLNARYITAADLGEKVDFVAIDVSFISLTLVLEAVGSLIGEEGQIIALIKPQFEQGGKINKSGIISNAKDRLAAVIRVLEFAESVGLYPKALCTVPRLFEDKNVEYPLLLEKRPFNIIKKLTIETLNNLP